MTSNLSSEYISNEAWERTVRDLCRWNDNNVFSHKSKEKAISNIKDISWDEAMMRHMSKYPESKEIDLRTFVPSFFQDIKLSITMLVDEIRSLNLELKYLEEEEEEIQNEYYESIGK